MPWKSRRFQLSCAARSVSTFFEDIVLCPFSEKLKAGRDARLACGCCLRSVHRTSGGFAGHAPVRCRGMHAARSDTRLGLERVVRHVMDLGIVLPVVALGIL